MLFLKLNLQEFHKRSLNLSKMALDGNEKYTNGIGIAGNLNRITTTTNLEQ